jgi:cephalosporin-C deacetylase-like acetyl esterase
MSTVEIRVRPVVRHIVTRYTKGDKQASLETLGEFDNEAQAESVADALRDRYITKPTQYAIVQRTIGEVDAKVYYAEERAQAEAYRDELMAHFGSEFRIFTREVTDPVAAARISVTPEGCWQPLGLTPLPPPSAA